MRYFAFSRLRSFCFWSCLAAVCLAVPLRSEAQFGNQQQQQGNQKNQPRQPEVTESKGTIAEVVRKGRALTLMIKSEAGGEPIPVAITPRLQFALEAKADDGFLREKQVVSGRGVYTNESLFVKNWTVYLGPSARRMRGGVQKAEEVVGESVNSYDVLGPVVSRQQDTDYPEYQTLTLNVPALKGKPVYIDKGATVTARLEDTSKITAGNECKVTHTLAPNGLPVILGVKVMLDEELKAEDYFTEEEEKPSRTSRRRPSAAAKSKDSAEKGEDDKKDKSDSE
jgi:hypothetical protein